MRSLRILPWLLPLLLLATQAQAPSPAASAPGNSCYGEIQPPVAVQISTDPLQIVPGSTVDIAGAVIFEESAPAGSIRFLAEDGATLAGPEVLQLGPVEAGIPVPFSVPVSYATEGRGAIRVVAEGRNEFGELLYAAEEALWTLLRPQGSVTGRGGYLSLRRDALAADIRNGLVTAEQAEEAEASLVRIDATDSGLSPEYRAFTPEEQDLNESIGAPRAGHIDTPRGIDTAPSANITIEGTILWTDENGVTHPAWGVRVDAYDADDFFDDHLGTTVTDLAGNYQIISDNDDPNGRDVYVEAKLRNSWIRTVDSGNAEYVFLSPQSPNVPDGATVTYSPVAANTGTGPAVSVFQAATWIAGYVANDVEAAGYPQVELQWPNGDTKSFYDGRVRIEQPDRWDWDTIHHEFGHYAADRLNIEDNPGGPHNIGDCIANVQGTKSAGNRMGWAEGWPTFFGTSGQFEMNMAALNVPRVGDAQYDDLEDGAVTYGMDTTDNNGRGEDNEVAVQRLLWDLYDSNADGRDNISRSDNSIWNAIKGAGGSAPYILSTYWGALRAGQGNQTQLLMGEIASDQQIGPTLNSPAENAVVSPSNRTFSWNAMVGCPSSYSGDTFALRFFDANTFAEILNIPKSSTSHVLTDPQLATLAAVHDVIWAVEGAHVGTTPITGPYLGESFAITVNTPPVADAGPDQPNVECASHTTTEVDLDGTGSTDPDGDTLTYLWAATGVSFDDATSATPTGDFPKGQTEVVLTVSDGIASDTDTMYVNVIDTTPPMVTCPDSITVECTSHLGTPKSDAQLIPFFSTASASDVCDPNPVLTNDAPDYFPLGTTPVKFTAQDASGNTASCTAYVTVEDTTPPEFTTLDLNRYSLWPPNHKMADIEATVEVEDICDPNPTFVLVSIASNEADNGLGDGDFANDIQGAAAGTADTSFRLRSERMGPGDGRKYSITYQASDSSGNTADSTVCVIVPHDQSGAALPASGFTADGTWIRPGDETFSVVVFSDRAADILQDQVYIGNLQGVIEPVQTRVHDANGDGTEDLVATYSREDLELLRRASRKQDLMGLHYVVESGSAEYLVPDVFVLGAPIRIIDSRADHDDTLPEIADGSDPGAGLFGDAAVDVAMETAPGLFLLPESGALRIEVFNVLGRRMALLADSWVEAGSHDFRWDGRDADGVQLPSGVYFYRVQAPGITSVRKVVVAR